jgi:hypothetical protein
MPLFARLFDLNLNLPLLSQQQEAGPSAAARNQHSGSAEETT